MKGKTGMQLNKSNLNKNEYKKYDNSIPKKFR
jgi:hypothetical protein